MFCVLFPFAERGMDRKTFRDWLRERGIATGVSYEALHTTTLGRSLGYGDGDFPNAERISRETLTLPLHPALTNKDVDYVCCAIAEVWQ
jgi:dTDP-4-amino-4,6-dideoxygalactose transaminase